MNQPESKQYVQQGVVQKKVMQHLSPPSTADLLLMAKLFYLGEDGLWVRGAETPMSEPAKRLLRNWGRKGYVYHAQNQETHEWLLVLEDDCARMCWDAIAAAFDERIARSMLDQKPPEPQKKPEPQKLSPRMWVEAAVLTAVIVGLLVASVLL